MLISGASSGIGLELTRQYAHNGFLVYACYEPHSNTDDLNQLCKKYQTISTFSLNITDESTIKTVAATLRDKPIDILINNAGIFGKPEHLADVTSECMVNDYRVNTMGTLCMCKYFMNNMLMSELKTIVCLSTHIASIQNIGLMPKEFIDSYGYSASKAAMNMAMAILSTEYKTEELKVLLIAPGKVHTPMGDAIQNDKSDMYTNIFGLDFIDVQTSVAKMRALIEQASDKTEKLFYSYNGTCLNW